MTEEGETKQKPFDAVEALSEEQKEQFVEFKKRLFRAKEDKEGEEEEWDEAQKAWVTDMCLCRYLRAREWDLDKSEEMIRGTLKWKQEYKPESITAEDIESEAAPGKMYSSGTFDKLKRPIIYMKPRFDNSTDRVIKLKYLVYVMDQAIAAHRPPPVVCRKHSSVAFMLNAPWVFSAFWKCVTPFIAEETMKKIVFIGSAKNDDTLLEVVDKEVLEVEYGGENDFKYDHEAWKTKHFKPKQKKKKKKKKKRKKSKKKH